MKIIFKSGFILCYCEVSLLLFVKIYVLLVPSVNFNHQGRVVRKPVNANPGLKVNRGNNFSCMKVLSIAYVLCNLRLLMLKTEGQKI